MFYLLEITPTKAKKPEAKNPKLSFLTYNHSLSAQSEQVVCLYLVVNVLCVFFHG